MNQMLETENPSMSLLVNTGHVIKRLVAHEFLTRNSKFKDVQEYNTQLNEVRTALIGLRARTKFEKA